jgi:hypothetical protein
VTRSAELSTLNNEPISGGIGQASRETGFDSTKEEGRGSFSTQRQSGILTRLLRISGGVRKEEGRSILADIHILVRPAGKALSEYECPEFGCFSILAVM